MKKVVINSSGGGNDLGSTGNGIVEKDMTLGISKIIEEELKKNGIEVLMLRDSDETISYDDRIKKLKATYPTPHEVVLLSNTLNTTPGIDIIYPLKKTDTLASSIARNLEYFNDTKYYQYRWPSDTTKDYYYLTRNTPDYETIIIRYGNPTNSKDANILKNDYESIALSVADAIIDYIKPDNGGYIVKSGDTLYSIAKKYNTSIDNIKKLNNLSSNNLSIGQVLKIESDTLVNKDEQINKDTPNTYIVKSGDTLYSIAKKFNISVDNLKLMNNKNNNLISIGEELKINDLKPYIIKSGDTLYSIAKNNNTTVDKLKDINGLKNNNLTIGNVLYIP